MIVDCAVGMSVAVRGGVGVDMLFNFEVAGITGEQFGEFAEFFEDTLFVWIASVIEFDFAVGQDLNFDLSLCHCEPHL
jgi:hypothetical protein